MPGFDQIGAAEDAEATSNGSTIAILKRLRTLLGGTGSVRVTDGVDEALITGGKGLHVNIRNDGGTEMGTVANPLQVTGGGGGVEYAEDTVHVSGDTIKLAGVVRKDADTANVDLDGDRATLLVDSRGLLKTECFSGEPLVVDSELEAATALADATANPTSSRLAALLSLFNGTTWDRVRGDITNGVDVDVTRVSGNVAVNTSAGQEVAVRQTVLDPLDDAGAAVTIKFADVNATVDGDNTVVAAVAGKKIRVIGYVLTLTAAGAILFKSGAATTKARLRAALDGGASYSGGLYAPAFETNAGDAFIINNPAGVDTLGHVTYMEV